MFKKCTNSACRRTFSTLHFAGACPFCGKKYPQIEAEGKKTLLGVRVQYDWECKVRTIKIVRKYFLVGLREAKTAVDASPKTLFILSPGEAALFEEELRRAGGICTTTKVRRREFSKGIRCPGGKAILMPA